MEPPHDANPLASLVLALQDELGQLKEEMRKRDSVRFHSPP